MPWRATAGRPLFAFCLSGALLVAGATMPAWRGAAAGLAVAIIGAAVFLTTRSALPSDNAAPPMLLPPPGDAVFERARFGVLAEEIGAGPAQGLVEVFLGDATERLAAMRSFIAAGERKALERSAHSLKSSAATFGFARLAALAREIEGVASTAPAPRLLALANATDEALESGCRAWRAAA